MYAQQLSRVKKQAEGPLLFLAALWGYPAFQADIMGLWRPLPRNHEGSGMIGDIAGIPVTEGNRARVAT